MKANKCSGGVLGMLCVHCGREISNDSDFCKYCGANQLTGDTAKSVASTDNEPAAASVLPAGGEELPVPKGFRVLNANGRLNRLKYLFTIALCNIGMGVCVVGVNQLNNISFVGIQLVTLFILLMGGFLTAVMIIAAIKRFHDLNEPGVYVLWLLVPFVNLYAAVRLLVMPSENYANKYGPLESNAHYWQVPLLALLAPVIFFLCAELSNLGANPYYGDIGIYEPAATEPASLSLPTPTPAPTPEPTPEPPTHYYSAQYAVSIDFPGEWVTENVKGFVQQAHDLYSTEWILVQAEPSDYMSFSDYTDADFEKMKTGYTDKDTFAQDFGYNADHITSQHILTQYVQIGGHRFLEMCFDEKYDDTYYQHTIDYAVYNGYFYAIQSSVPTFKVSQDNAMLVNAVQSFRFGSDAQATAPPIK